ncbi:MAG: NAD(P)H-dependent oxidoreductase subunit E [Eubacterium sp.]
MEDLKIEVCVCTECVMKGAMDIIESIESLNDVKDILELTRGIVIDTVKCIGEAKHGLQSPIVCVGGHVIENAKTETVMAQILEMTK